MRFDFRLPGSEAADLLRGSVVSSSHTLQAAVSLLRLERRCMRRSAAARSLYIILSNVHTGTRVVFSWSWVWQGGGAQPDHRQITLYTAPYVDRTHEVRCCFLLS